MPRYVEVDREPKARKPREPKQVPIDGKLRDALFYHSDASGALTACHVVVVTERYKQT